MNSSLKIILILSMYTTVFAYTDVDDSFDFEGMVNDKNQLQTFLDCLMDRGPCTNEFMTRGKKHLREATLDSCAECDDVQRHMYHVLIDAMEKNLPEVLPDFIKKFDNSKQHFQQLEKDMDKY